MAAKLKNPKLVHVTTVPQTWGLFRGQIGFMKERGFEVHAVSSPGDLLHEAAQRERIPVHAVPMPRRIAPGADLVALFKLYRVFRRLKPDIVHGHTPKGGFLAVVAARWARVPIVLYTLRGLRFVTETGWRREVLQWSETLACQLSDRVFSVSRSVMNTAVKAGLCPEKKILVLAQGSSNGVDASTRFNPLSLPPGTRAEVRQCYRIPQDALVTAYVGRIVRDKGIVELAEAWQYLRARFSNLYILLVGSVEPQDPVPSEVLAQLRGDARVRFTGKVRDMPPLYAAMDVLVLPTYREGFPNTPLEAAAMEVPVAATRVDGCMDAVLDGITGLLVPPRDAAALGEAIEELLLDSEKRRQMGESGRRRVLSDFRPEMIWESLYREYRGLLNECKR